MLTYSFAVVLDTVVVALIFSLMVWWNFKKNKEKNRLVSEKKAKTSTIVTTVLFFFLLIVIVAELFFPALLFVTRLLMAFILGMLYLNLPYASEKAATHTLIVIALVVFMLLPKIELLYQYPGSKVGADSWGHVAEIDELNRIGSTTPPSYYSVFPLVYSQILFLSKITGVDTFYSSTIYYLVLNLFTALTLWTTFKILFRSERKNAKTKSLPLIGVLVYSIVQYPNTAIVNELPQAVGFFTLSLAFYLLVKLNHGSSRRMTGLGILAAFLSLAHPFAPIFLSGLYFSFVILSRVSGHKTTHLKASTVLLPVVMEIAYFVTLPFFGESVSSFWSNFSNGVQIALGLLQQPLYRFGEVSMNIKYLTDYECLLYGLNWAVPTAAALSLLAFGVFWVLRTRKTAVPNFSQVFLCSCALLSAILAGLAFIFSPVEYAFSRYFGAYAVMLTIPVITYLLYKGLQTPKIVRGMVAIIVILAAFATLTDYNYLPDLHVNGFSVRERRATFEIDTSQELHAASFFAQTSPSDLHVLTDLAYSSTVSFFVRSFHSFTEQVTYAKVDYPISSSQVEQYVSLENDWYVFLRQTEIPTYLLNRTTNIVYNNGGVIVVRTRP